MNSEILLNAARSVNLFVEIKRKFLKENLFSGNLINEYSRNLSESGKNFLINTEDCLNQFQVIQHKSNIKNSETSYNFNVFSFFTVGEKQHSYILAYLLNPASQHGQGHLFLNIFLDLLGIERISDKENWVVTAEKGRIDILLKRIYPHSVIVIENKSNYASDQNHQLYRYWYQEIYRSIMERHLPAEYIPNPPEKYYQLLYLSPEYWKIPGTNTLSRPPEWDQELPDTIPVKTKHLLFDDFIYNWLKKSLDYLPVKNYRMREFVEQYIEYWN